MKLLPVLFLDKIMFPSDINFYVLAVALFLMGLLLIAYALIVLKGGGFSKKKSLLGGARGDRGLGDSAYQDALKILDRAKADSLKILGRAQSKAQGVLNSTYEISKENREKLDSNLRSIYEKQEKSLSDLTKDLVGLYKSAIEEGKEENIRTLYEATESMKKEALKDVSEFKEVIKKETSEAKSQLEDKIKAEYANIEPEIEAYKAEKLKNLNNKIFDILANVYTEVIKQDLDQVKYEKLIISMLKDELRKSGVREADHLDIEK